MESRICIMKRGLKRESRIKGLFLKGKDNKNTKFRLHLNFFSLLFAVNHAHHLFAYITISILGGSNERNKTWEIMLRK